jgi:hypothetical protein
MTPGALPVVLGAGPGVAEHRPGLVDPLHLLVVALHVGVEDPREHAVGRLDHERARGRVDLEDPVEVIAL